MRDNVWLEQKLDEIWRGHFADIPRSNEVTIAFGQRARRRLGSIRQVNHRDKSSATKILITGYFTDEIVPESIVSAVIAHELTHYAHGFASPHPQFAHFPHQGGIVDKELVKRGFEKELKFQKSWLKTDWPKIIGPTPLRRRARRRRTNVLSFNRIMRRFGF